MDSFAALMMTDLLGKPAWMWASFMAIVVTLLAFDLGVLHREDREIGVRQSLLLSGGYICISLVFGAWVWSYLGAVSGMQYFTGFLIEKSLSIDNIFVIALIFTYLAIPRQYQHRVLFWGILGVIVLRAIMIGLGAVLVTEFSWILYLFGAFLFFTGVKMLLVHRVKEEEGRMLAAALGFNYTDATNLPVTQTDGSAHPKGQRHRQKSCEFHYLPVR